MATAKKATRKAPKARKDETKKHAIGQRMSTLGTRARQAPHALLSYGDAAVWKPYKAYWRWGWKLAEEPRAAVTDLKDGGREAASKIGLGAKSWLGRIGQTGKTITDRTGEKLSSGLKAFPSRFNLVDRDDIRKLSKAVDRLSRKVDAMVEKSPG
jgi:hypothetical protein